jgi:hypothetical protein
MVKSSKGFTQPDDLDNLFRAKVESSGLTVEEATDLGMTTMTSSETAAAGLWRFNNVPALRIPYFDPLSGLPLSAAPSWPQFYRARALRLPSPLPKGFQKYLQPAGTGVCAYFSKWKGMPWSSILSDPGQTLLITEGELKAAKAVIEGYPTIGLGGVWNFRREHEVELIPELARINWVQRNVHIVFDSDLMVKPDIAKAAWRLAEDLYRRGAIPYILYIPPTSQSKAGLDDFLIANGRAGLDEMIKDARKLSAVESLWELNNQYAVLLESDNEVVELYSGRSVKRRQLEFITTKQVAAKRLLTNGSISYEPVNAATLWFEWPLRSSARRLIFEPSQEPLALVENDVGGHDFNTWKGLAVSPKPGDVKPFTDLIDHLFTGAQEPIKKWFLDWLAYPLKYLGTKLFSAVVIHGLAHGSGKTLVGETMKRIYGKAYTKVGQAEIAGTFNEWAASRLFVLGDDITGIDRLAIHDAIKVMITQSEVRINQKNVSAYEHADYMNWLFTSNRANAFYIDAGDRRFFVWEVTVGVLGREFYRNYMLWLEGDGPSHLLHYFLSCDLSDFDPGAAAPETFAKKKMREEAQSDAANWVEDLRSNSDALLTMNKVPMVGDLFTSSQLSAAYARYANVNPDDSRIAYKIGAALASQNFQQVHNRKIVSGPGIDAGRYYAIRNPEKWAKASLAEIQAHLRGEDTPSAKPSKPRGAKY